jgi:transposase, IS30 family
MTKKYNQLTLEQRYKIEALKSAATTQTKIAEIIGVHKSTISREFRRNIPRSGINADKYIATRADQKTRQRHKGKPKLIRFNDDLKRQAKQWMIDKRYSPEFVSAQWTKDGIKGVSYETVYKFIWECKHSEKRKNKEFKNLYKHLKHRRRHRKRGNYKDARGLIPNRVSIEKRPKIVDERKRFGDIEVDLIMGKAHKSALLVTVDRATLKTTIDKLKGKDPKFIANKIIERMNNLPIKTITFDNDPAFSLHQIIAGKLNAQTYFTRPYTSQDKGTIENRNGVIRRFFPKKTDFNNVTIEDVQKVENEINNRPIRKFQYLSANEVFSQLKGSSVALIT